MIANTSFCCLPEILFAEILTYLNLISLAKFDQALTNKTLRIVFLNVLSLQSTIFASRFIAGFGSTPLLYSWLDLRGIQLSEYCVDSLLLQRSDCCQIIKRCFTKITFEKIKIQNNKHLNVWIDQINQLETLELIQCSAVSSKFIRYCFQRHPSIHSISFSKCFALKNKLLEIVASSQQSLKSLDISGCSKLTNDSILIVKNYCLFLESLNIERCYNLTNDCLVSCLPRLKFLKELQFGFCNFLDDTVVDSVAKHLPCLSSIGLKGCSRVSKNSLNNLFICCTNLRKVSLGSDKVDVEVIRAISQHCPKVEMLDCSNCPLIDNDAMVAISRLIALQALDVSECSRITTVGLAAINIIIDLRVLVLNNCARISDAQLLVELCRGWTYLRLLDLRNLGFDSGSKELLKDSLSTREALTLLV